MARESELWDWLKLHPAARDGTCMDLHMERVENIEVDGELIEASRLGYRMTARFQSKYFGRIFMHPHVVFSAGMLRPEEQDIDAYAESV